MKERPILFSAPMIRAILAGHKTQTRRVMKPAHVAWIESALPNFLNGKWDERPLPYGKTGDRLWVRETWLDAWAQNLPATSVQYHYRADPGLEHYGYKWRPAIHMPREASRILLEVTGVRVERLQDISCADAIAEGIRPEANSETIDCDTSDPRKGFSNLWSSINGASSWDTNPWVWVVSFKREVQA